MNTIPENELRANLPYYKRLLILSEIGGQTPRKIAVLFDEPDTPTPKQIAADLARLHQTLEAEDLPDDLATEFNEVFGTRKQIEEMEGITLSDTSSDQLTESHRQQVDEYVARCLTADEEVGFSADLVSEWFYRRVHQERLIQEQV